MKFEAENLNLLDHPVSNKATLGQKKYKLNLKIALFSFAAILATVFILGRGPSAAFSLKNVPQFKLNTENGLFNQAERTLFVAHQLSKFIGASSVSQFYNIPDVFSRYVQFEQSSMSSTDKFYSQEILDMMRLYQSNLIQKESNPAAYKLFWARISAIFNLDQELFTTSEEKASGKQLEFWSHTEKALTQFSTPTWINKQGKAVSTPGPIVSEEVKYD